MNAQEWQERQDFRRRQEERRMAERASDDFDKELRWQKELRERADGKDPALWVRWYEV